MRLVDGSIQKEGRVEVCSNGVWGSVCDQSWDKTDAHVICQQMGHPELGNKLKSSTRGLVDIILYYDPITEPVAFHNSYFGDGHGPIVYSNVTCGGWEQSITDCAKTDYLSFSCSRRQTAGVLCGESKLYRMLFSHNYMHWCYIIYNTNACSHVKIY